MKPWMMLITPIFLLSCAGEESEENVGMVDAGNGSVRSESPPVAGEYIASEDEPPSDLLTLAEGAVLLSASANERDAIALLDGAPGIYWRNQGKRDPLPYEFIFELSSATQIESISVTGAGARAPGGVPGGSAKNIIFSGSSAGPESGYSQLAAMEADQEGETQVDVSSQGPVRWLKVNISSNHGSEIWTYLNEISVFGAQSPSAKADFTGIFQTGRRDFVELKHVGSGITGCYGQQGGAVRGKLFGDVVKDVARLSWRSDDGITGAALFALDSQGRLNGVRYRDKSRNPWSGPVADSDAKTQCSAIAPPSNPIAEALEQTGNAQIYGILFDHDQATLKPESTRALEQLQQYLQKDSKHMLTISGHTDAVGDDAYNQSLSSRRAQAVVDWLVARDIAKNRLIASGKGETDPVASNETADGRALNRRVEASTRQ